MSAVLQLCWLPSAHPSRRYRLAGRTAHTREAFDRWCKGCSCAEHLRAIWLHSHLISSAAIMAIVRGRRLSPSRALSGWITLDAVRGAAVLGILLANVDRDVGISLPPAGSLPLAAARGWHELSFFLVPAPRRSQVLFALLVAVRRRLCGVHPARGRARGRRAASLQAPADGPADHRPYPHVLHLDGRHPRHLRRHRLRAAAVSPARRSDGAALGCGDAVSPDRPLCVDGGGGLGRVITAAGLRSLAVHLHNFSWTLRRDSPPAAT